MTEEQTSEKTTPQPTATAVTSDTALLQLLKQFGNHLKAVVPDLQACCFVLCTNSQLRGDLKPVVWFPPDAPTAQNQYFQVRLLRQMAEATENIHEQVTHYITQLGDVATQMVRNINEAKGDDAQE